MFREAFRTISKAVSSASEQKRTNNMDTFSEVLIHLYEAQAEELGKASKLYYSFTGNKVPEPTPEKVAAEKEALDLLKQINPNFTKGKMQILLDAHKLLGTGCYAKSEAEIKEAVRLLNSIELFPEQRKAFLETRVMGNQTDPDFKILGFLGYASKRNNLNVVEALLNAGANPGSKPLLEKKDENTFDHKPIFFSVATNVIAWIDYRTTTQRSITVELVPFDTSVKHIKLYLNAGFDINTSYQKQNVLQHAYTANLSGDMHYHVHLIAHTIATMYHQQKISQKDYKLFCQKLQESDLLKLFPVLVEPFEKIINQEAKSLGHSIYKNSNELHYYLLRSLLFNLIGLCAYEQSRINNDMIATISSFISSEPSAKSAKLLDNLNKLKTLQTKYCTGDYHPESQKFSEELCVIKNDITRAVCQQRFIDMGKTIASTEWNAFLTMNAVEVQALEYQFTANNLSQSRIINK